MDDLIEWLRAQLDEDEQVARNASPLGDKESTRWEVYEFTLEPPYATFPRQAKGVRTASGRAYRVADAHETMARAVHHIVRHDPARVLAEVDAKRRIVELHERDVIHSTDILSLLALPYAARPGYKPEWRP